MHILACSVVVARGPGGVGQRGRRPGCDNTTLLKPTTPLTGFVSLDEGSQSHSIHTWYHRTQYYSLMCIYHGILQNDHNAMLYP